MKPESVYPFFETIRISQGKPCHLEYHQQRLKYTFKQNFPNSHIPDLQEHLSKYQFPHGDLLKCRFEYNENEFSLTFNKYTSRTITTLKVVRNDETEYSFKYTNRSALERLLMLREDCDDILIIKNGMVTDTSYSNIAFGDGNLWYTPSSFLLRGTTRERLILTGKLTVRDITMADITSFKSFKLINSMLNDDFTDFREISGIVF